MPPEQQKARPAKPRGSRDALLDGREEAHAAEGRSFLSTFIRE